MNIKRTLDTIQATYDLTGLSKKQFSELLNCYEKQMFIYYNRQVTEDDECELYNKMKKMADSDTLII